MQTLDEYMGLISEMVEDTCIRLNGEMPDEVKWGGDCLYLHWFNGLIRRPPIMMGGVWWVYLYGYTEGTLTFEEKFMRGSRKVNGVLLLTHLKSFTGNLKSVETVSDIPRCVLANLARWLAYKARALS